MTFLLKYAIVKNLGSITQNVVMSQSCKTAHDSENTITLHLLGKGSSYSREEKPP